MSTEPQSALVTGGAGFIGSHLIRRLLAEGTHIHVLIRKSHNRYDAMWRIADLLDRLTIWPGDLTDADSVQRAVTGSHAEMVFHLAGTTIARGHDPSPADVTDSVAVNLGGTLNLLAAIRKTGEARCLVHTGGLEEYGDGPAPYQEDQREQPVSAYSASQVAATMSIRALQVPWSLPVVILRPALVYGPGQSADFFIPSLILHGLAGLDFEMTGGTQGRDLIHVEDLVDAYILASRTPQALGQIINIGCSREYVVKEVAEEIVRRIGGPTRLKVGARADRPGEIQHLYCDNAKARELLGWSPTVELGEGFDRTIAWYRQHQDQFARQFASNLRGARG